MDKVEVKTMLNSRQWALYRYLKDKGDQWTTQEQIAGDLQHIYFDNDYNRPFHDRNCRKVLTADIRAINESDYIHKPILSSSKGIKLANEQEWDKYIANNINSTINRLKRLKKMAEKADKNGQMRIKLSDYQKEVYESFIDGMQK